MNVAVRQAAIVDLEKIVPLFDAYRVFYASSADTQLARRFLGERFSQHQSTIFLAEASDDAIGFAQLYPQFSSVRCTRTYLLNDLFVAPHARRQHVGAALLNAVADYARSNGAASLSLSTAVDNLPAQELYESLGWKRETAFCEYALFL